MIARVIYGLADQGMLPNVLATLNTTTGTPLVASAAGIGAALVFALTVPQSGLADLTARLTLVIFVIINLTLITVKGREKSAPPDVFVCPAWVPVAGLLSSAALLALDLFVSDL